MNIPTAPQSTTPLTKGIRTLEGILVSAANVALVVIPIATTAIPPVLAVKLGVALNIAYAISRAIVKAFATPVAVAVVRSHKKTDAS